MSGWGVLGKRVQIRFELHSPSWDPITQHSGEQWNNEEGENTEEVRVIVRELGTKEVVCDAKFTWLVRTVFTGACRKQKGLGIGMGLLWFQ